MTEAIYNVFERATGAFAGSGTVLIDDQTYRSVLVSGPSKAALTAYAARRRWEIECGGTTISGMAIATDDRAKLLLAGARAAAEADPAFTTRFKTGNGWMTLDAASVVAVSDAVAAFVNRLFAGEDAAAAGIAAGDITTTAEIDATLQGAAAG